MEKRVITLTLNPAVDRTLFIDGFTGGGIFVKENEQITAGGKGINVSRALNVLGVKNLATGILGGCSGKITLLKLMRKEHINQDFYKFGGYTRTNVTVVDSSNGKTTQLLENGPKVNETQVNEFLLKFKEKLKSCSLLMISGRNAVGVNDNFCADLIKLAHEAGAEVIVDTHGKPLKEAIKNRPFAVVPNLKEAEELLGQKLTSLSLQKKALSKIYQMGVKWVFIKLGEVGAIAFDGKDYFHASSLQIKKNNDVGCGDAFSAGVIYGYLNKMNFDKVLGFAVSTATASALTSVPAQFDRKDLNSIFRRIRIKKLN